VFDPCTNIAALGQILTQNYQSVADGRHPQTALRLAISLYNTGSTSRGFRNGYVAKVIRNAGITDGVTADYPEPAPPPTITADIRRAVIAENAPSPERRTVRPAPPPAWNLFERAAYERKTPTQSASEEGTILWSN
jgi:type IV secretion system protein VirB1